MATKRHKSMTSGEVIYIDTKLRPDSGSFCRAKEVRDERYQAGQWYYCRELFHGQLYNLNLFFFSHDNNKQNCISTFMQKVEDILDVQPRSKFGPTQRKKIMWIEPSKWWTVRSMRRSLFTILLRAGNQYILSKKNFEEALYSDPYTMSTRYAVERFLAGHTVYTGRKKGWHQVFYRDMQGVPLSSDVQKKIDELLVKPDSPES